MQPLTLIADSGSTKAEWCLLDSHAQTLFTQGISPYFLGTQQIVELLQTELAPDLKTKEVGNLFFYGTGCASPGNAKTVQQALQAVFPAAKISVETDLMAAARAGCGHQKGVACILGTGSNSCFYNGKKITRNSPGLGYVLGDEGSGAYLGKKVVQYYLYGTFDEELLARFNAAYNTNKAEILEHVYRRPLPNRYLAAFALFLSENRAHFMIENIIEDGLNDFFFQHLNKYPEIWKHPVHFTGSVAWGFQDVIKALCTSYGFELGTILKSPMQGLVRFHEEA